MSERTSPVDAIKRLSWILNYVEDGPQSLNSLANQSDLSWATVQKYTAAIEVAQKVAPRIVTGSSGVEIGSKSRIISDLTEDPVAAFTVYLLTQAEIRGGAGKPVDKASCEGLSEEFENVLTQAIDLGWVSEIDEERVKLTPTGVRVAGPARSNVENTDQLLNESNLYIHQEGDEEVVTLADEAEGSSDQQGPSSVTYNTDNYQDKTGENRRDIGKHQAAA